MGLRKGKGEVLDSSERYRMFEGAELIRQDKTPEERREEFLGRINRFSRVGLRPDQVYIRSMYLCSTRLCRQDWGRFSEEALGQISELLPGKSLIVGHDRSRLPIARFFHAEVIQRPDDLVDEEGNQVSWVRAWFYWLRETSGAKDLLLNIDGGIYREVSISWRYEKANCSICSGAIRKCRHTPGRFYGGVRCTFEIEKVCDVLEGSIVYKGAEERTGFESGHADGVVAVSAGQKCSEEEHEKSGLPQREWHILDLEATCHLLNGLPRKIESVLSLGKSGVGSDAIRYLFGCVGVFVEHHEPRSQNLENRSEERLSDRDWDLVWVGREKGSEWDPESGWWKRVAQKAGFVLWETDRSTADLNQAGKILRQYLRVAGWQPDLERMQREENRILFVRENR